VARRLLVTALLLLTTACSAAVPGSPVAVPDPVPMVDCEYPRVDDGPMRRVDPPGDGSVPARGTTTIRFDTSHGRVDVELDAASAPCSVHSFRHLVAQRTFQATSCHRLTVEAIWVLQCGDPTDTGFGGPGYKFDDPTAEAGDYARGVVAMASEGKPGTNGSQFFITYKDSPDIGPQYAVIGRVTQGMDVVDEVAAGGVVPGSGYTEGEGKPTVSLVFLAVEPA
jgi:peptidyl-prolyl cis-trans isomerase B (cyclophilin B)